jgi:hypothetical protein
VCSNKANGEKKTICEREMMEEDESIQAYKIFGVEF